MECRTRGMKATQRLNDFQSTSKGNMFIFDYIYCSPFKMQYAPDSHCQFTLSEMQLFVLNHLAAVRPSYATLPFSPRPRAAWQQGEHQSLCSCARCTNSELMFSHQQERWRGRGHCSVEPVFETFYILLLLKDDLVEGQHESAHAAVWKIFANMILYYGPHFWSTYFNAFVKHVGDTTVTKNSVCLALVHWWFWGSFPRTYFPIILKADLFVELG